MSFPIVSLIILVVVAIIAILIRVFGEAARRNPNRPGDEGQDESGEQDSESDRQ